MLSRVDSSHPPETKDGADALLDLLDAIFADEFVLAEDVGGDHEGHCGVLDMRDANALAEYLTGPWSAPRVRIKSFTGRRDQEIGLDDIQL
jgi:hypothetical protein